MNISNKNDAKVLTGKSDSRAIYSKGLVSTKNKVLESRKTEIQTIRLTNRAQQTLDELLGASDSQFPKQNSIKSSEIEHLIGNLNGRVLSKQKGLREIYFGSSNSSIKTGSFMLHPENQGKLEGDQLAFILKALEIAAKKGFLPAELITI